MPRLARCVSASGFYHVVVRGNGRQMLFESEDDRLFFLNLIRKCFQEDGIQLLAWCLMDNHIHLLVEDKDDRLSHAMLRTNTIFAMRFNENADHVGHVFQGRYHRKPVESEAYLLEVVRYIHRNPEEAGISSVEVYPWSSYREYLGKPCRTNTSLVLSLLGGVEAFEAFCKVKSDPKVRLSLAPYITEDLLLDVARDVVHPVPLNEVATLDKASRDQLLCRLFETGFSIRQIERLTGIGRNTVSRSVNHVAA